MAWCPFAEKLELQPESDSQPAIRPTQMIVHSIVAPWSPRRTYEYWRDATNLESHFGVGYDGSTAQYIGTETRADANASANRRPDGSGAVSVETASNATATDPWTDEQVEALIRLGVWLHQRHGLPLRICRTHDDPGYGYHRLHRAWSTSGTACPGDARVRQFREVVFPGIVARASGQTQQEDDMQPSDKLPVPDWIKARWPHEEDLQDGSMLVRTTLVSGYGHARTAADASRAALAELGALRATVEKLAGVVATGDGLTAEEIKAAAEAGAQAALDRLGQALTGDGI